jgi:FkbM family methyltransferase
MSTSVASGHPALRFLSRQLYGPLAKSPRIARWFLLLMGNLLRAAGSFPLKSNIINSLVSHPWPAIALPSRSVRVGSTHSISLVPHVGEFDFVALFSNDLGYESELFDEIGSRMPRYDAVIEIGANVGVYSAFFVQQRRSHQVPVFCFEPSMEAFARLNANVKQAANFHALPAAVSDRCGLVEFFEPAGHLTNGSLLQPFAAIFSSNLQRSLVVSVDGTCVEELVRPFDSVLLKIDVEGAEETVLRSLQGLITSKRPEIVLEVLEQFAPALNSIDFIAANYRLYLVTETGLQEQSQFNGHPRYRDYLLLPRNSP